MNPDLLAKQVCVLQDWETNDSFSTRRPTAVTFRPYALAPQNPQWRNTAMQDEHETLKAKQIELAQQYVEANPSEVTEVYWLYAIRQKGTYPKPTPRSGKWLIFVDRNDNDAVWATIKEATEAGRLGGSAKVATAKPNPYAMDPKTKVICVYTYDWTDEADVRRIRGELRALGITQKISYKADADTLRNKYRVTGHRRISKYYE